jgi:hypothetical protein
LIFHRLVLRFAQRNEIAQQADAPFMLVRSICGV